MSKIFIPETSCADLHDQITTWLHAKFGPDPEYDTNLEPLIAQYGLPWFRAGALVVNEEGKILLIHEGRVHINKVKDENFKLWLQETGRCDSEGWADGDGGWNIPSGRLIDGESFERGVQREVLEESWHNIEILGIIHVRWGKNYVMPTYLAKALSGPEQYNIRNMAKSISGPDQCCTANSREVLEIGRFSVEGIRALNDAGVLRSPESVMDSLDAYEAYLRGERQLDEINAWDKP